jgi:hypothetical protein
LALAESQKADSTCTARPVTDLAHTISTLPSGSWIPIAVLLLAGAAAWAAGRRLLRTGFAGLGLLAGGAVGWILGETLPLGLPAWATAVAGALLLTLVSTMAYKAAVAAALAVVLASVAGLGVLSAAGYQPRIAAQAEPSASASDLELEGPLDQLDEWLDQLRGKDEAAPPPAEESVEQQLQEHLEHVETVARQLVETVTAQWEALPEQVRRRLVAALLVGGVLGFVLGTLASAFSASLVTAFGGGLALLIGAWAAFCKLGFAEAPWLPDGPRPWLTWWVLLSIIGLMIQWTGRPRRADKPA